MKILVGWDTPDEADLLMLYLSGGEEHDVVLARGASELIDQARAQVWDVILLTLTYPETVEQGYQLFTQLQSLVGDTPIVMACRPSEMISLPRFLIHGLRFYIYR